MVSFRREENSHARTGGARCLQWPEARDVFRVGPDAYTAKESKKLASEYVPRNRVGDHECDISDLSRFGHDYPGWRITRQLHSIVDESVRCQCANAA